MKARYTCWIFALILLSCSESDEATLVEKISGDWTITDPYFGVMVGDDLFRSVPPDHPEYKISITKKGEMSIYEVTDAGDVLLVIGTVETSGKKKLTFDPILSAQLNTLAGFFEETIYETYTVQKRTSTTLEINYSFYSSALGTDKYEGFLLTKIN